MPVGPVGNIIYANQVMHLQAVKQTDYQNSIQMQGVIAASMTKEKENEVEDVRPAEEAHKIDPEKEHQRETDDKRVGLWKSRCDKKSMKKKKTKKNLYM